MALALSSRILNIEASISHLFLEADRFSLFASFQRPLKGSPLVELSKHERGTGRRIVLGPLLIDAALAATPEIRASR